ncbi:MAG: hypothetical protein C0394_00940 [Syntrophus sp. (in: bacteria)]|nr:hypothetical protein [Syntrophus sp. (in: bacteria)]
MPSICLSKERYIRIREIVPGIRVRLSGGPGVVAGDCRRMRRGRRAMAQRLKRGEANIQALIEESLQGFSRPTGVRVIFRSDLTDPIVRLDGEGIGRMLVDLMLNACEAMPAGGELTVTLTGNAERIEIVIQDTGVGISPEHMDELFTPFFTTKPLGKGTGLGLALTYATVKAHAGQIAVESNADSALGPTGTTIRITLPRRFLHADPDTRMILHGD